jgi:hypothetical protein
MRFQPVSATPEKDPEGNPYQQDLGNENNDFLWNAFTFLSVEVHEHQN